MNISPRRMAQIMAIGKERGVGNVSALEWAYINKPMSELELDLFEWLATDPTPTPLTVADLDEADRLGYALAENLEGLAYAHDSYLRDRQRYEGNRSSMNKCAVAVIEAYRTIQRDRGDVVVPGDRDEDADAEAYERAYKSAGWDVTFMVRRKAGIRAVIAHHAERGDAGSGRG